jgi:hypothetical protein
MSEPTWAEPDLGPTREQLEQGFEPHDAIGRDGRTVAERAADPIIEPPEWEDELDTAYGAADARQQLFAALKADEARRDGVPEPGREAEAG